MAMNVSITMKLIDGVTGPIRRVTGAIANASKAMEATKAKADAAFKRSGEIRQAAEGVASFAAKARAAVGVAVSAWQPFQSQMARVQALTKANGDEFAKMSELARTLGATGRFGAVEVAHGMEELRAEGFGVTDILKSMPMVIDAAVVSNRSLSEVIGATAGTMDAFGLGAEHMGRVIDVTTAVAHASGASIGGMGEALAGVGRDAVEAGISIERVAKMAGLMATKNIEGGAASAALSMMLKALTRPAGEGAQVLKQMGVSATETVGGVKRMRDPLATLTELQDKMTKRGVGVADQTRAMTALFSRAAPEVMAMLRASREPGMKELDEAMQGVTGSTAKLSAAMRIGGEEAQRNLGGAFGELARTMGEVLEPVTTKLTKTIEGAVRGITGWMKEHPRLTQILGASVIAIAAVSTALSGLLFVIGTMVAGKGVLLLAKAYGIFSISLTSQLFPALVTAKASMAAFGASTMAAIGPAIAAAAPFIAMAAAITAVGAALLQVIRLAREWDSLNFGEVFKGFDEAAKDKSIWKTLTLNPFEGLGNTKGSGLQPARAAEPGRGLVEVVVKGNVPAQVSRVSGRNMDIEASAGMSMSGL